MVQSRSIISVPPGATIKEQLADRGIRQKEFASRMGMSEKHISQLINGQVHLTADVALRLEAVFGIPASFWNNLEAIYCEKLAKAKAENEMDADIQISRRFPYNEMAKNHWVPATTKPVERVLNLRQFFEVARLELLQNPDSHLIPGIAYRKLSEGEGADYVLYAWAQRAKLEARKIPTHSIHVGKLKDQLGEIRKMTAVDPAVFCPRLRELFANCGVALVFLPHIGGSFLHGATFYDGNKIVLGMTVRGKDADRFWFSLFHEIAHVIYGHMNQPHGTSREDEAQADQFAEDALIPNHAWNAFLQSGDFSQSAIVKFARAQEIDPGIVVGRLQKEGCIGYNRYNDMKKKYEIV